MIEIFNLIHLTFSVIFRNPMMFVNYQDLTFLLGIVNSRLIDSLRTELRVTVSQNVTTLYRLFRFFYFLYRANCISKLFISVVQ